MNKKHLTQDQRCIISSMYQAKHSQKEIAAVIGKCKSVVSREINRNTNPQTGKYSFNYAQDVSDIRKERFRQPR
jgi:IS30 family transposase